ncbi:hypothetical protein [Thermomonas brevis]
MPDIGHHEHDAPAAPPQWRDAFAALPLESPAPQAWQRLHARLPGPTATRRRRWPLWLAAAASLALAVAMPLRTGMREAPPTHATPGPTLAAVQASTPPRPSHDAPADVEVPPAPARLAAEPAHRDPAPTLASAPRARRDATPRTRREAGLESLYAESARLEALLAAARDDRTASSGTAALTDSLDAELAAIDATLIQPGLDLPHRSGLWRQRVDTLRQLAGIETTRRLLSARGETYDAALVSVD